MKGVKNHGMRIGNWLTADEGKRLLAAFCGERPAFQTRLCHDRHSPRLWPPTSGGSRARCRRHPATRRALGDCGPRRQRQTCANRSGPDWVKLAVDKWLTAAGISTGPVFRAINKARRIAPSGFSPKVIWGVVKGGSSKCGLDRVAPHDLRRTCARLCHEADGELEQIQFLLGHVSVQTTERYLAASSGSGTLLTTASASNQSSRSADPSHCPTYRG